MSMRRFYETFHRRQRAILISLGVPAYAPGASEVMKSIRVFESQPFCTKQKFRKTGLRHTTHLVRSKGPPIIPSVRLEKLLPRLVLDLSRLGSSERYQESKALD